MTGRMSSYPLLESVNDPADLRRFDRKQLAQLATELRAFIVDSVASTGGHLSSNLGTVELTIALHYVFQTPRDKLIWDVGHQTYGHKILTGRRGGMGRLRQKGGIAGFPRREESVYDTFGTAHSSTSISAALGMATAARLKGEQRKAVAIIGDGAMSAGMAFEAMNNAGVSRSHGRRYSNDSVCVPARMAENRHSSVPPAPRAPADAAACVYTAGATSARTGSGASSSVQR